MDDMKKLYAVALAAVMLLPNTASLQPLNSFGAADVSNGRSPAGLSTELHTAADTASSNAVIIAVLYIIPVIFRVPAVLS